MKIDDLEIALNNAKFLHLTDDLLMSYRDQKLDETSRRQADAHLELCLICERRLLLFQEEGAELDREQPATAEDVDLVRRVLHKAKAQTASDSKSTEASTDPALMERFAGYIRQAAENWQSYFRQLVPVRGVIPEGVEVWRFEDKEFVTYATLEPNADLILHFSSSNPGLEGAQVRATAGLLIEETIFRRISESEVRAEIRIPRRQRPRNLASISIEVV